MTRSKLAHFLAAVVTFIRVYRYVVVIVAAQAAFGFYAMAIAPGMPPHDMGDQLVSIVGLLPYPIYAAFAYRLFHLTYVDPLPARFSVMKKEALAFLRDWPALLDSCVTLLLLLGALTAFGASKRLVEIWGGFGWDPALSDLDRALFLGQDPWKVMHDLFGFYPVLSILIGCYVLWSTIMLGTIVVAAFSRRNKLARMQFLIAHLASWFLIGIVAATLLSSAGPVYYANLGLGDRYAPLMAILDSHAATYPQNSLRILQTLLWELYTAPQGGFSVISAMPSMHVASSMVIALYAFTFSRWLGWLMTGFAALIFIGSVMLAWHYFLDGVVAVAMVGLIWAASGTLAQRIVGREV